jgi:uncharacterized protein (DUF302 family)
MIYGISATFARPFDEVLDDVRQALAGQGFGVVSEVDMQATLRAKLGVEIDPQLILGACNPSFARRALEAEPSIGLLLPCNVVVRGTPDGVVVEMINPQTLVQLTGNAQLQEISAELMERLQSAMATLRGA